MAAALLAMPVMAQDADVDPNYVPPDVEAVSSGSWTFGTGGCPGGVWGRADLGAQTGSTGHLGIQYVPSLDMYWSSSRGTGGPPHKLYSFDNAGVMTGEVDQAGSAGSAWGYRDLASDGTFIYGGWNAGLSRHNLDGTGGTQIIFGAAPGMIRGLPSSDTSSPSWSFVSPGP